ncbi:OsmC family protein [Microbacterium sp. NPDC057650]|uniref:OsmC family protein n=1 Tax=unclassified Microbacterium TaxID=2609290 RepID=UPI0036702567
MVVRYRTEAINDADGRSRVPGGLDVAVASPLADDADPTATNPEQLLALAWATCLNGTAQVLVLEQVRTSVRVEVELHPAEPGPGYEFHVDAFLSAEGYSLEQTADLVERAHARCPVSKLLRASATVHAHAEEYALPVSSRR